ncbi:MAG TPA: hypothetical protein VGF84_23205 [Micromonosporaceae bacterium]|jgi:hypothetical protein
MSIAMLANRIVTSIVPTIDAHANCGRCTGSWTSTCCADPRLVKRVFNDVCGNKCAPTTCQKLALCAG